MILLIIIVVITIISFTIGGAFNEKTLNLFETFETNTTAFKREQSLSVLSNYKNILEKCKTTPVKEDLEHPLIGQ